MSADGSIIIDTELDDSKLKSGLGKLGSVAGTALKGIGIAAAAAAAAVVSIGTQAIKAYAEYEQLVGGVETLFGNSANIVMDYANNAFQTAGLSANEYMAQATSFSASLLQSLGGDTEAAAHVADMAISDMADNANKMGTSIESIQDAYQGFAKQNYTMLDNLKLGYGGTKEEMQRLLEDAEALSGVEYDISNLDDVFTAIHVIQEELGVTGTTALEASTTIQGSAASMKAAWENLLVGLADDTQDFDTLLKNFIESVGTFAENLIPRIGIVLDGIVKLIGALGPQIAAALPALVTGVLPQLAQSAVAIVKALVQGISDNAKTIAESAAEILTTLITGLIEMAPMLLEGAIVLIGELAIALGEQLPTLIPMAYEMVMTLILGLIDNIDLLVEGAISLMIGLAQGLVTALPLVIAQAPVIIQNLVNALVDNLPLLLEAALQIIVMLVFGIISNLPQIVAAAGEIISSIVTGIIQLLSKIVSAAAEVVKSIWDRIKSTDWIQLGRDVLNAFVDGIRQIIGRVISTVTEIVNNIWNKIKNTDWLQLGRDVLNAIVNGIRELLGRVAETASNIVSNLWDKIKNTNWLQLGRDVLNAIVSGLRELLGNVTSVGENLVQGLWNGISGSLGWIKSKLTGWVGDVMDFLKNLFGVNSPSKVMADEIGKWLPPGIVIGMENAMPAALRDVKSVAGEITEQIQNALLAGQNGLSLAYATVSGVQDVNAPAAVGNNYTQNVYTHDSLSPYELTMEFEAMKAREGWQLA